MLYWALMFLVVALVAALFGFGGIASTATGIAQILFVVALVMFLVTLLGELHASQFVSGGAAMRLVPLRLAVVVLAGALAAACTSRKTAPLWRRASTIPAPPTATCRGTEGYRICAEREAAARSRGRMAAGYAEARMAADAQEACLSYGLVRGTDRYDRCVSARSAIAVRADVGNTMARPLRGASLAR